MGFKYLFIIFIFFLSISCCFAAQYDNDFNLTDDGSLICENNDFNEFIINEATEDYINDSLEGGFDGNISDRSNHCLNDSFNSSLNNSGLEYGITAIGTTITANNLVKYFSESGTLYAYLKDSSGNPLSGKTLVFTVKGVSYSRTTNSNGCAGLAINLYPGTFSTTISFSGSGYTSSSKTVTVQVKAMPTSILVNDLTFYYSGGNNELYAYLKDRNNNPLVHMNITCVVGDRTYTSNTDNNGRIKFTVNKYPGFYSFKYSFSCSGYLPSSKNALVTVKAMPTKIIVEDLSFIYGEGGNTLYATLKNYNDAPMVHMNITCVVGNQVYVSNTDNNGQIRFVVNKNPGTYYFNYTFSSPGYVSFNKIVKATVLPIPVTLTSSNLLIRYTGNNFNLDFYLKDKYNNPLSNQNLTYTIDESSPYNVVSNSNGRVRLTLNLNPKLYNITFSYSNNPYQKINTSFILKLYRNKVPCINYKSGFYNKSHIIVNLDIVNAGIINYSWDNSNWSSSTESLTFKLTNGIYDLYYKGNTGSTVHEHYIIDNKAPVVWSNYVSDLYDSPIHVNISSWDNVDGNPLVYYTLDGSNPKENGILYQNPILISNTTTLKYYSKDSTNHATDISVCNYIFACVGNINTGKGYSNIQSAIDDVTTVNGNTLLIKSGSYNDNIIVNKSLNLIGAGATLSGLTTWPVIDIDVNGSGSLIYGFNIINSEQGININGASNVSIINNTFCNVLNSINTNLDNNTVITDNIINDTNYYTSSSNIGIKINKSKNLLLLNNIIVLNSKSGFAIKITNNNCNNVYIKNNTVMNKRNCKGYGIYVKGSKITVDSNYIYNFAKGIYVSAKKSVFNKNVITSNNYGINLVKSINNLYKSNNIYNNSLYGVFLSSSLVSNNDSFYLNRLCGNVLFDLYSEANCQYIVNDNWWGKIPSEVSANSSVNIYNGTGNVVLDSWVVMRVGACSYKIGNNALIERASFYVDMTYNNLNECLSYKGFIPDNIEVFIACFNSAGSYIYNVSYLKDGLGFVTSELSDLYNNDDFIYVYARLDYNNITLPFNKLATISITIGSRALDMSYSDYVNYTYFIDFVDESYWISVSWSETGLYTGVIDIIVNGVIVKSINISNVLYQCYKEEYGSNVFEAMKLYNEYFASVHQGDWVPNNYYLSFASAFNLDPNNPSVVSEAFLSYIQLVFNLSDNETNFIRTRYNFFVDSVIIGIGYYGDRTPNVNFDYNGEYRYLDLPSEYVYRISKIYYSDIEDEYGVSIGYEGMRSFAITKSNLTNADLAYWLNKKPLYSPGLMKAAYGTFLTAFLVIWENDRVADDAASRFNVTWSRTAPVCVSLCNDYNCLYITGESDHRMGREAVGNVSNVWKFNFATSFSFSLIEQLVGNNVWNDTTIGSVTLGLLQSYLNNETLEIFASNGYIFLKILNDYTRLLFLDIESGVVRDEFSYYGLLGTMPCYHDGITERAWGYGSSLLNSSSIGHYHMKCISTASTNNLILNEFTEIFAYLFQNFDSIEFLDNLIIGILGSEIVSIATIIAVVAVFSLDPDLFTAALMMGVFGEIWIAYSDGIFDDPNVIDIIFFGADSVLAIGTPFFGGGLKVGTQTLKIIIEKSFLRINNHMITGVSVKFNLDTIEWSLGKIIFENIFNKPVKEHIHDFIIYDLVSSGLHEVFSNIFDYYYGEA